MGWPGEYPFTRGLHPTGYRGRTWTIRQFAGFGNAEQTNERYKMILAAGGGGSVRRLRHADADGARLRRPPFTRRGRALRGRHRLGRRHGGAIQGHPWGM
ncbi:methylmalonyl-CoA mutase family protein [Streptomyces tricolor]|nr:methylmalonyl-CoA mutase family protein [Streptomyces tricolor]